MREEEAGIRLTTHNVHNKKTLTLTVGETMANLIRKDWFACLCFVYWDWADRQRLEP